MEIKIMQLDISPKTKIGYKNRLDRLNEAGYDWSSDIYETEYFFENIPIQTKQDLLTVIIVLRRDMDFTELRKKIQKEYALYRDNKLENLHLMTTDKFVSRLNELYKREMYEQFVLNYLMYKFGVRNMDLQFTVGQVTDENYLIKDGNSIIYQRNKYKTVDPYGPKTHVIRDKKFIDAFDHLPIGLNYDGDQIAGFLQNRLILKEGDCFKMRIKDLEEEGNTKSIRFLASSRGTAIESVLRYYNLNTKKYTIK